MATTPARVGRSRQKATPSEYPSDRVLKRPAADVAQVLARHPYRSDQLRVDVEIRLEHDNVIARSHEGEQRCRKGLRCSCRNHDGGMRVERKTVEALLMSGYRTSKLRRAMGWRVLIAKADISPKMVLT
jgi:hypothetical protein